MNFGRRFIISGCNSKTVFSITKKLLAVFFFQGTVRAYFADGNGGQVVTVIEELDLVMAFYAGNYNDAGGRKAKSVYVPQYILPSIVK